MKKLLSVLTGLVILSSGSSLLTTAFSTTNKNKINTITLTAKKTSEIQTCISGSSTDNTLVLYLQISASVWNNFNKYLAPFGGPSDSYGFGGNLAQVFDDWNFDEYFPPKCPDPSIKGVVPWARRLDVIMGHFGNMADNKAETACNIFDIYGNDTDAFTKMNGFYNTALKNLTVTKDILLNFGFTFNAFDNRKYAITTMVLHAYL